MRATTIFAALTAAVTALAQLPDSPRFDLSTPSYDLWRSKKTASNTVQQSFTFDQVNRRLFIVNRKPGSELESGDLTISELDFSGNLLGSMDLIACGHGVNIAAESVGSDTYIWSETDAAASGYGKALWRFKFEDGKTLDSADAEPERIIPFDRFERGTATIDAIHEKFVLRYQYEGAQNIAVFELDDAKAYNFSNALVDWPLPQIKDDLGGLSNVNQGYTVYGRYVYLLTGESYDASGGVLNSEVTALDLNTGDVVQGPLLTKAGSTLEFREPEGLAVYQTADGEARLFLGFSSGSAGDRRSNLFYKNVLI
ncbi:putative FacC-like extracellular signaling protein [Aspergillus lucknowensis]|uniref:P68 RBP/TagC-like beta-propeller domain-containing protein n=1 Tax=Aspergillus lucknowensis TaxID=176173 RepID=A0ABR4LTD7_9EURO